MKVLHLPTAVGGNAFGLARAETELGLESRVLIAEPLQYGQKGDISLNLENGQPLTVKLYKLAKAFLECRSRYDVFHFNYGLSLINFPRYGFVQVELPFYPKRARLFVTYNGCDARQKFPTMQRTSVAACHQEWCYGGMCNSGERDRLRQKGIAKMARHVEHIWALNPDLLRFLPPGKSSFLPYTIAEWANLPHRPTDADKKTLKIVHAPTDRAAKGTGFIVEALEKLAAKYPGAVEVRMAENLGHRRLLEVLGEADLVVDQILIGWYGALAVEAMKMGKPVIARIARDDLQFLPPAMAGQVLEGVIDADPATLFDVLARCLEDRAFLRRKSLAGRDYVHHWHDPATVARITAERYEA
ncbi:MAG: glycosyltransferase [Nitrospinaceae bacterium]